MTSQDRQDQTLEVDRAFGASNRDRLLRHYFDAVSIERVSPDNAWLHVYRLLMWIDRTIGLAHCYESDKCQPGRPWYGRSLRFHDFLAREFSVTPGSLADEIDWLFSSAVSDLARSTEHRAQLLNDKAEEQREPYAGSDMPLPGEDPELEGIIAEVIAEEIDSAMPAGLPRRLSDRIHVHIGSENKRKNLVGEGFEDTLAAIMERTPEIHSQFDVYLRPPLHDLPGFNRPRGGEKTRKVDLALVRRSDGWRVLVSCKWSVRSDREEQFATDWETYARLESSGQQFAYVLVTNEFDPARLSAACEMTRMNSLIFSSVVHVNTDGPLAVYNGGPSSAGIRRAAGHIDAKRLQSLRAWLEGLSH